MTLCVLDPLRGNGNESTSPLFTVDRFRFDSHLVQLKRTWILTPNFRSKLILLHFPELERRLGVTAL
jgi:hypothetical protein